MMTKKTMLPAILLAASLSACASVPETVTLADPVAFKAETGAVAAVTEAKSRSFMNNQSSKAAFGALGGIANAAKANKVLDEYGLEDPAPEMETKLQAYLAEQTGLTASDAALDYTAEKKKPKTLTFGDADYYVDATTLLYGVNYFPTNWTNYQTYYTGDVRLFDGETGEIVAHNVCTYKYPETAKESPKYDELMDNDAALLKANVALLADRCVEEFKTKALGF